MAEEKAVESEDGGAASGVEEPWYAKAASGDGASTDSLATVSKALEFKETGNRLIKDGANEDAVAEYKKGIDLLLAFEKKQKAGKEEVVKDSDDEDEKAEASEEKSAKEAAEEIELREVKVSLHLNSAMALLKLERWDDAIACADDALAVQPENVKALYRRGVARSKLAQVDGAVSDLQACVKLEPGNRDAKRELAKLTDKVRQKRLEEKRKMGAGLQKATSAGLYGDKELAKERKKREEAAESARKRKRHEKFNEERKAKGEDSLTFSEWEKKDKEEVRKREEKEKAEQRKLEKARDEARRKQRAERGEDRVVVDDELDLKSCKGYKTLPNGRRTSYFTNVPDQTTAELLQQQQAPKKIDSAADGDSAETKADGSAWNAAGTTFEERDMKGWVDDALKRHLKAVAANADGCAVLVTSVKKCSGEASLVISRGKARHVFEYTADLAFEATFPAEAPPGPGPATVKGVLHLPEISSSITDGNYESTVSKKPSSAKLSRPRLDALNAAVANLQDAANTAIADFVVEYQAKKLK